MTQPKATNIQNCPPLDKTAKQIFKEVQNSKDQQKLEATTKTFLDYLYEKYYLEEAIVKVRKSENSSVPFDVEVYPRFKNRQFSFMMLGVVYKHHHISDFIKTLDNKFQWKGLTKELKWKVSLYRYDDWISRFVVKRNKPINDSWVTDMKIFCIEKQKMKKQNDLQMWKSLFFKAKSYQNRPIKKLQFMNSDFLKREDVYELGYKQYTKANKWNYSYKIILGTNVYSSYYLKLKGVGQKNIPFWNNYNLQIYSKFAIIEGKRLLQHELYSRSEDRWMKQRSKQYFHTKAMLDLPQTTNILSLLKVSPYVSGWLSRNSKQHIKIEGQYGLNFNIRNILKFNLTLFQLANEKRNNKFVGFSYAF